MSNSVWRPTQRCTVSAAENSPRVTSALMPEISVGYHTCIPHHRTTSSRSTAETAVQTALRATSGRTGCRARGVGRQNTTMLSIFVPKQLKLERAFPLAISCAPRYCIYLRRSQADRDETRPAVSPHGGFRASRLARLLPAESRQPVKTMRVRGQMTFKCVLRCVLGSSGAGRAVQS